MARTKTTWSKAKGAGWGGDANGAGWGGPAKGAGSTAPRHPDFEPGNTASVGHGEEKSAGHAAAKTARELVIENAVKAAQVWIDVMTDLNAPHAARVAAAAKVVEHAEGTPIARTVNVNANATDELTDAELGKLIDTLRKDLASGETGADGDSTGREAEASGVSPVH